MFFIRVRLPKLCEAIFKIILIVIISRIFIVLWLWLSLPLACSWMYGKLFVNYCFFAESALRCSRFALFEVSYKVFSGNIEVAILAMLRLHEAILGMLINLAFFEHFAAMLAFWCGVKLLLMVFQKVLIVHLPTGRALYDVSATVPEMCGWFWDGNGFVAVRTGLSLFHNQ